MTNNDIDRKIQKLKKELSTLEKRRELQELQEEKERLIKKLESKEAHSSKPTRTAKLKRIKVPLLKNKNIYLMVLFSFLTFGLYIPYWFLSRQESLNKLPSKLKLTKWVLIFFMVLMCSRLIINFVGDISKPNTEDYFFLDLNESGEQILERKNTEDYSKKTVIYSTSSLISWILSILIFITVWTLNFIVKDILQDAFKKSNIRDIKLSSFWTFFFGIFYLQHKINQANKKGFYTTTKTVEEVQSERFLMTCLVIAFLFFIISIISVFCMGFFLS